MRTLRSVKNTPQTMTEYVIWFPSLKKKYPLFSFYFTVFHLPLAYPHKYNYSDQLLRYILLPLFLLYPSLFLLFPSFTFDTNLHFNCVVKNNTSRTVMSFVSILQLLLSLISHKYKLRKHVQLKRTYAQKQTRSNKIPYGAYYSAYSLDLYGTYCVINGLLQSLYTYLPFDRLFFTLLVQSSHMYMKKNVSLWRV